MPYRIYSIESRKGGVGKTTVALNLACILAKKGPVLLLDCDITGTSIVDPAKNSSFWNDETNVLTYVDKNGETKDLNLIQFFLERFIKGEGNARDIIKQEKLMTGGVNANSLLLYSGPVSIQSGYRMVTGYHRWRDYCETRRPGCLYTGDSDCDLLEWEAKKYSAVWNNIGTIQLPHHGSFASFDIVDNPIDKPYIIPVSCGCTNSYGHPSGKVLAYLMTRVCTPKIVTEMGSTVYMQRIVRVG